MVCRGTRSKLSLPRDLESAFGRRGCAVCVEAPDGREVLDQRRGRPRDLGAGARRAESTFPGFPARRSGGKIVVGGATAGIGETADDAAVVVGGPEGGGQAAFAEEGLRGRLLGVSAIQKISAHRTDLHRQLQWRGREGGRNRPNWRVGGFDERQEIGAPLEKNQSFVHDNEG